VWLVVLCRNISFAVFKCDADRCTCGGVWVELKIPELGDVGELKIVWMLNLKAYGVDKLLCVDVSLVILFFPIYVCDLRYIGWNNVFRGLRRMDVDFLVMEQVIFVVLVDEG
jgi:hypothetical protein